MVARSLSSAVGTQPEWAWELATKIATDETSAQVREAVPHALARLASDRPDEVVALLRSMYAAEAAAGGHESLLRGISDFLVEMWVWRGHRGGRELIDEWIADIRLAPARPRQVFFALRDAVTHGGSSVEHFAVRERAIGVWADLTRAALDAFQDALPLVQGNTADESVKERVASLAALLDGSATEVYFASGAYSDGERQLKPEVRERFYREGAPLIDVLVNVGIPSAAHHMLQTLASFVDFDPRGVLLRIGRLLDAGRAWGYQLEGLAETEFVRLVERYLASHRDLFVRDPEARMVLINATEGFIEAGWPSARRLLYGLDDMFR